MAPVALVTPVAPAARAALAGPAYLALVVLLLVLAGCRTQANDAPPGKYQGLAEAVQAAHQRMHLRFTAALRIEQAISHSDLPRAQQEARTLATVEEPDVLSTWRPYFDSVRDAAHQVELAGNVVAAAQLTAELGRRCARCHESIDARIPLPAEPAPASDPRLAVQMMSHQWAAAQMWQGLIGPSDDRWLAGARQLTTAPLEAVAQAVTPVSEQDVDDVARVRLYATRALTMGSQDARAELYGKLLATCAHCHAMLRDR